LTLGVILTVTGEPELAGEANGGAMVEGFTSMMEAHEAMCYAKYWENYAPQQISPGTTRYDFTRISGRTVRMENLTSYI
jgi:hypothetical protein